MKKMRFAGQQIIAMLKDADAPVKAQDLCRERGTPDVAFDKRRSKYGGLEILGARRSKQLADEDPRVKSLVADLTFNNQALKLVVSKKCLRPRPDERL